MNVSQFTIDKSWKKVLHEEFSKTYFSEIKSFLVSEIKSEKVIYPSRKLIFNAFNRTPFDQLKVVILGQDPYHNPGEAMGLCFSVPNDKKIPPSLKNIYKELHNNIGFIIPNHGDLSSWADQGVFLLNAILTVEHKLAGSHKKIGWQTFTDEVIKTISNRKENVVFLLWGNFAKAKRSLIDESKHCIFESAHPSPLAGKAFFDNQHFSKTNDFLISVGKEPINWQI